MIFSLNFLSYTTYVSHLFSMSATRISTKGLHVNSNWPLNSTNQKVSNCGNPSTILSGRRFSNPKIGVLCTAMIASAAAYACFFDSKSSMLQPLVAKSCFLMQCNKHNYVYFNSRGEIQFCKFLRRNLICSQ